MHTSPPRPLLAALLLTAAAAGCALGPQAAVLPTSAVAAPASTAPATAVTAPAAAATAAATPTPAPIEPGLALPVVTAPNPVPVYPMDMLRARQHGLVYVECVVDEAGRVVVTRVRDSADAAFNATTEEAVRHWTFKPGTKDGVPIPMRVLVPVAYLDKEVSTVR